MSARLVPVLVPGSGWRVDIRSGNRKKANYISIPLTGAVYTLAQAQAFVSRNRASDYAHHLRGVAL